MISHRWALRSAWNESVANLRAGGGRARTLLLLAVVLGGLAAAVVDADWARLEETQNRIEEVGGNTIIVAADAAADTGLSTADCAGLNDLWFVRASGHMDLLDPVAFSQLGNVSMPVVALDQSLIQLAARSPRLEGTPQIGLDGSLGTTLPFVLSTTTEPPTLYAADPIRWLVPGIDLTGTVVIVEGPVARERTQSCVTLVDPRVPLQWSMRVITAAISASGPAPTTRVASTTSIDVVDQFTSRPTRFVPLIAALILAFALGLVLRSRSSEIGAYRLSGTSPGDMALILIGEATLICGLFLLSGCTGVLTLAVTHGPDRMSSLPMMFLGALIAVLTSGLTSLRFGTRDVLVLAKDR